jgi:hypothetical protein
VFPIVFYSLAALVLALAALAGRHERFAHLRPTLWVSALLLALGPGLFGTFEGAKRLNMAMVLAASVGGMVGSVVLRERKAFWAAGAGLVLALLILFGQFFDDSIAFTCFAIVLGVLILAAATWLSFQKDTWLDRVFAARGPEERPALPSAPPPSASPPDAPSPAP